MVHTDRSMYIVTRCQLTLTDPHAFFSVIFSYHSCQQFFSAHQSLGLPLFENNHHQQLAHLHFSHTKPAKNQTHSAIDGHGKVSQQLITFM